MTMSNDFSLSLKRPKRVTLIFSFLLISTAFLGVLKTQQGAWFIAPTTPYIDCIYLLHAIEKEKERMGGNSKSNMERQKKHEKFSLEYLYANELRWIGFISGWVILHLLCNRFFFFFFFSP